MNAPRHIAFLSWQSVRHEPWRSGALCVALWIALALPALTWLGSARLESSLLARSEATPILVGAPGNDYDLALSSLYFRSRPRSTLPFRVLEEIRSADPGPAVPLYLAHTAQGRPIVATDLSYLDLRGLEIARGRRPLQLGEVVAGAAVAERLGLSVGDRLRNDLTNLYNLAGAYPFLLEVVGVLEPSSTADDQAFFTGLRTGWTLDGRLHGHQAIAPEDAIAEEDGTLEASAAVFLFAELSEANRDSFHLHGDPEDAPVSAILVFPPTQRQHDLLLGRLALRSDVQAVRPSKVVESVLEIVLGLRRLLQTTFALSTMAMGALFVSIVSLTHRLRRRDLQLFRDLGASGRRIFAIVAAELGWILLAALGATLATLVVAAQLAQRFLPT